MVAPDAGRAPVACLPLCRPARPAGDGWRPLDAAAVHPGRSGRDHLRVLARAAGVPDRRADALLARVGLEHAAGQRAGATRWGCASGSAWPPRCWATRGCWSWTSPPTAWTPRASGGCGTCSARSPPAGCAVLVSSHALAEVAQTVDDVVVISGGRSVLQAPLDEVLAPARGLVTGGHLPGTDRKPGRRAVMTRLISAEALKLRSTRTFALLALGALALIVAAVAATSAATSYSAGQPGPGHPRAGRPGQTAALLAGALAVTGEFRHKTITLAVLAAPRRVPLLAAKLITLAAAGLAFGLVATGAAVAVALPVLAARHIPAGAGAAQLASIIAGGGAATALAAALGVGVGAVIRNQVGAVIAVLSLLYVAEPMLGLIQEAGRAVQTYGLGGLAAGATGTAGFPSGAHLLSPVPAALVLAGYALAVLLAGAAVLRRRDIAA